MFAHTKYLVAIATRLPASSILMRRLHFSLLWLVMSGLLLTPAVGQVNYRLQRIPIVVGLSQTGLVNEMNNLGMVVGAHTPGGVITGFVYDHYGFFGAEKTVHSITKWIAIPAGWTKSSCVGINNYGQVVGYFEKTIGTQTQRIGYYLDLNLIGGGVSTSWNYLPTPSVSSYGVKINDNQDVLIYSADTYQGHLYNLESTNLLTLKNPSSSVPLALDFARLKLNNAGQVVGRDVNLSVFRLTPGLLLEFPPLTGFSSINDDGEMAGTLPATGLNKTATPARACRYSFLQQVEGLASTGSYSSDINNSRDVIGGLAGSPAMFRNGEWLLINPLVVGDTTFWNKPNASKGPISLSERDGTGFGQILVQVDVSTTTGSGRRTVTTTEKGFFVLTPELLP